MSKGFLILRQQIPFQSSHVRNEFQIAPEFSPLIFSLKKSHSINNTPFFQENLRPK